MENLPNIRDWYLISKSFRRPLKDLRHGRSSDGPWFVFKSLKNIYLEQVVKVLDWSSISIFESSSNVVWCRKSSENLWKISECSLISKTFRRSLNDLWSRITSEGTWLKFDPRTIFDLVEFSKIFELSFISKNFPRSLNDLRSWRTSGSLISKVFRRSFLTISSDDL